MHGKGRFHNSIFNMNWRLANTALPIMLTLLFLIFLVLFLTLTAPPARAQTYNVIHNFTGGEDGRGPAGLTLDRAGNLYGTTVEGGPGASNCGSGCGIVYKLSPHGPSWVLNPLYSFTGGVDGGYPVGAVTLGLDGTLFGTNTTFGSYGGGTVFNLRPRPTACSTVMCPWTDTVIYQFGGSPYSTGTMIFDSAGNLYGTTHEGGYGYGTVFELTLSEGIWTETDIYNFDGDPRGDGVYPGVSMAVDGAGNLYGTSYAGGSFGWGTVFELTRSGSSWTKTLLYSFQNGNDGHGPAGGVVSDRAGNLYGGTLYGGNGAAGAVYELTPSNGRWKFAVLYTFSSGNGGTVSNVTLDSAGNVYGATYADGAYGEGSVFKLTPSNGGWTLTDLHDFTGGNDGGAPKGAVAVDATGNIYGTATQGGAYGQGVIWKITP